MLDFYNIKGLFPDSSIHFQSKIREILETNLGEHINTWWNENKIPNEIPIAVARCKIDIICDNNHLCTVICGDKGLKLFIFLQNTITFLQNR